MSDVEVDMRNRKVTVINYTDNLINRPFGSIESPTMADLENFLEGRCFPKARANCQQLLLEMGLEHYDPLAIIMKTHGRQWDDYNWILFDGEVFDYEKDIKLRE